MSRPYLLFQLYGQMASWGEIAVGEVRPTANRPSKSAVLGLVAAALGIKQSEEEKHQVLNDEYRFAVRLDAPGQLLRDYHTTEVPTGKRARDLPSRRDEVEYDKTSTIQSWRDYRCDAHATVCLWAPGGSPTWLLENIADALREPTFALYLGRKSCPPSLPLAPEVVTADTLREAFEASGVGKDELTEQIRTGDVVRVFWEDGSDIGFDADQVQRRRDDLVSRKRWQYQTRDEHYATLSSDDDAA